MSEKIVKADLDLLRERGWEACNPVGSWRHPRLEWSWSASDALLLEAERDGGEGTAVYLLGSPVVAR